MGYGSLGYSGSDGSLLQGKIAHLITKHRDLFNQHHQQCLQQQQVTVLPGFRKLISKTFWIRDLYEEKLVTGFVQLVYSPDAPGVLRLMERQRMVEEESAQLGLEGGEVR